jgi:G3E family GTPase
MAPIAVTLLTGFLGAGKTTLLRHILNEQHGFKIAVIENEFGEVSVDDQLIGDRATQIKTLTNGCICCSNELEDALLDLLDSRDRGEIDFDRLVIECTGMADPGPIIQTFFSHEILCERYLLDGVIALVDAVHADQQMNQFTIAQSQVGYADRILLTKTDVAGDSEKLRERLARINARAPIYTVTHGDIDLSSCLTPAALCWKRTSSAANRASTLWPISKTTCVDCGRAGLPGGYQRGVAGDGKPAAVVCRQLMRYKGMLWIDGEPNRLLFQGVQRLYSADWDRPWGDEAPHSTLVFIGIKLPEEEIRAAFAGLRN